MSSAPTDFRVPDPSEANGQDQFQQVANRRAGYTESVAVALTRARHGYTLGAGEGKLIVEHYEERLKDATTHHCDAWRMEGNGCVDCSRILLDYSPTTEDA
jgi:hypothetical protein